VSFFTSSSDPHRRYFKWLLTLPLVSVAALFVLGIYLEPLYGDLTRVGFYSEREFGWNKPQQAFSEPVSTMGRYDRYHDVVVLGDSVSTGRPELQWQNYLGRATGWSVVTLDINKIKFNQVLANPVFRKTPPKVFILELVERDLPLVLKQNQSCNANMTSSPPPRLVDGLTWHAYSKKLATLEVVKRYAQPIARETRWRDINVGFVRGYLWYNTIRHLGGDLNAPGLAIELAKPAPFSSRNNQSLLVFRDDMKKVKWWRDVPTNESSCRIEAMRGKIEANRHTRFIFMAAPDKLTAYADFVSAKKLRNVSALAELSKQNPDSMPRIDLALKSAIAQGVQDVYLPNDTHWGSTGNQIAAEALLATLQ
jgi:hypothetical protein